MVAEVAYRNEYIAVRGQAQLAEEAWRRNKCRETPPGHADAGGSAGASTPAAETAAPFAEALTSASRQDPPAVDPVLPCQHALRAQRPDRKIARERERPT